MKLARNAFNYTLPQKNIALQPAHQRERSKLLVFQKKAISHHFFKDIPELLAPRSTLFFNDTKVIRARLFFHKQTGGQIEVMLLNPAHLNNRPIHQAMCATDPVVWQCAVRNVKKWKENTTLTLHQTPFLLEAELVDKHLCHVRFSWKPDTATFSQVIAAMGHTPLPPYLHGGNSLSRDDKHRYQTVYCRHEGGVAAPTAGLHFSNALIEHIRRKGMLTEFITLHVGAGTFQPIRTDNIFDHDMHAEQLVVTRKALDTLLMPGRVVIAVGTTSVRVLESLYWLGVSLLKGASPENFFITKNAPYEHHSAPLPSTGEALEAVRATFPQSGVLIGQTAILIVPGYQFRVCKGLITNFHLPGSTLIPLIAAFVGDDWKRIYQTAIERDYRFLSYGDSSLLLP